MADFSIEFEKDSDIPDFLQMFKENIKRTPFIQARLFIEDNYAFFHIKPLIFPIYWIGILIWVFGYVISGFKFHFGWIIAGLIPFSTALLHTKYWYLLILYIGKYKGKYRGKIKVL